MFRPILFAVFFHLAPFSAFAPQPPKPGFGQQGTCAFVAEAGTRDDTNGTHIVYGAAWNAASIADAKNIATTVTSQRLNGAATTAAGIVELTSGCGYAHGAVVVKPKTALGTGALLGDGIYDVVTAHLAASTDDAVSAAMNECNQTGGVGGPGEVCQVSTQW